MTVRDSGWLLSWTVNRQPHFKEQPADQIVVWIYGLFPERLGEHVRKPMQECTGEEITREWLYHLGVPADEIEVLAATAASCVPVMMPYVTAFFLPRRAGDRPDVVPAGAVNFAFIGQFAETTRDTVFTTEYSVRTAMEATYRLLGIDRGVPEVAGTTYDVRTLLATANHLRDGRSVPLPGPALLTKHLLRKLESTEIGELLTRYNLIPEVDA